ncbi:MAG: histidinol-phosphate transaminase [Alphaproteobacteria bacterium]|jgi:histidinol-phosphate aminotransferase|nr:histidinol-phosphate transaminase [Alphaproteobacteria bacterium]
MALPTPRPGVLEIAPYIGGESRADAERVIRLASNESPLGPSPQAVAAYSDLAGALHRYPDGGAVALRAAIAARHDLDPARIVCGAGSDELIALLINAYAGPGDEVLHSAHGFLMYAISAKAAGARPVAAPETDLCADVDVLLEHVSARTRLVFLANPNNPTGSFVSAAALARLRGDLPEHVLLVVDAAYAEYVSDNAYSSGMELVHDATNVVMTRTFSKIYGLSALRLGWAYCPPPVADVLNRVRGPFNVSTPAQAAGAAAIADTAFTEAARVHAVGWRDWTAGRLRDLGLTVHPSIANFLLIDFSGVADSRGGRPEKLAEVARLWLKQRGILVRQMGAYGLPHCLRMSIGTAEDMPAVVDAVGAFLGEAA